MAARENRVTASRRHRLTRAADGIVVEPIVVPLGVVVFPSESWDREQTPVDEDLPGSARNSAVDRSTVRNFAL
jgi:hypothetical protein